MIRFRAALRVFLLAAFVTGPLAAPAGAADDPLESFNRAMHDFNEALVFRVINPAVDVVSPYIPEPVVTGLGNAYDNLTEIEFILNNTLAGDTRGAGISVLRFVVNSTAGIAGVFDVADGIGLTRVERDYGESLCRTGIPPGPFLILPLVGATNVVAAPLLAGAIALEVYGLSFLSTTLAMADFLIIDLGGSAAALRYSTRLPEGDGDTYAMLRDEYGAYIDGACIH